MEHEYDKMRKRHQQEEEDLKATCSHNESDIAASIAGGFFCKACHIVMPDDYRPWREKKKRQEEIGQKIIDLKIEILPSGKIRFKRGDRKHNREMKRLLSYIIDGDEEVLSGLNKFFHGSEDVELLVGDTILCG